MSFIESSTKAGCLSLNALWKQDGFRWKLYENRIRMSFTESSTKTGSVCLSLNALRKQDDLRSQPFKKSVPRSRNICHPDKTIYCNFASFHKSHNVSDNSGTFHLFRHALVMTKNRLMVATERMQVKVVKWCWKKWNGLILMYICDKECESMQKNQWKGQTFRVSVFTMGRQELFAKNMEN